MYKKLKKLKNKKKSTSSRLILKKKCHDEILNITILIKQKMFFFKNDRQEGKIGPV
jgi:predicted CopG family antitoxin